MRRSRCLLMLAMAVAACYVFASEISPSNVEITLVKKTFALGADVPFRVHNRSHATVYYTYGCEKPLVERWEGGSWLELELDVTEALPDVRPLNAGGMKACLWNQKAWQDPDSSGPERFQLYNELLPVPPGRYRLGLVHYDDPEKTDSSDKMRKIHSQPFTIE